MSQRTPLAILALIALLLQSGCYLITPVRRSSGGGDDDDQASNDDDADDDDAVDDDDASGDDDDDDDDDSIPDGDDDDDTPPPGDDDDDTPPASSGPLCDIADEFECGVSNSGLNSGSSIEDTWAQCVDYGAGYTGGESVFEWQAASSGSVTVNLNWSDSGADLDLFVLSSCESSNTCLGESSSTNVGESVTVNVSAGDWYYIVVDGWDSSSTSFTLTTNEDCSGGPVGDDDDDDDDDDATPSGDEYGPPNDWFHTTTLPPGLSGTGWNNGQTPPNFSFVDQNGDQVELYQFYGKVIMLDVFAEWCGPCNDMAPEGESIWNSHPDIVVLAVMEENSWGGTAGSTDAARWESTHNLSHPIMGDTSQSLLPQISAYPSFWAIDRTMTIADADFWPSQSYLNSLL